MLARGFCTFDGSAMRGTPDTLPRRLCRRLLPRLDAALRALRLLADGKRGAPLVALVAVAAPLLLPLDDSDGVYEAVSLWLSLLLLLSAEVDRSLLSSVGL